VEDSSFFAGLDEASEGEAEAAVWLREEEEVCAGTEVPRCFGGEAELRVEWAAGATLRLALVGAASLGG
jgi:hypothetical protein